MQRKLVRNFKTKTERESEDGTEDFLFHFHFYFVFSNQQLLVLPLNFFETCRALFAGPEVVVGVTMYVLSISSLSEVEMVHTKKRRHENVDT